MSILIKHELVEKPDVCFECMFRDSVEDVYEGDGLYKKISRCRLSPEEIEDPYRTINWQMNNVEEWCPIVDADREKGEWIPSENGMFVHCSKCGCYWESGIVKNCNMEFCPSCGTDMRGD